MQSLTIPPWLARLSKARPSVSLPPPVPGLGVEISPTRVAVVNVKKVKGGFRCLGHGFAPLPEGTVVSALLKCTIADPDALVVAVRRALEAAGAKPGRASLTLPDVAGRVSVMSVPGLPRSRAQAEELIRFRVKRSLPFRPEDLVVSFTRLPQQGGNGAGGVDAADQVLAVMAVRSVIEQHERTLAGAGLRIGVVSLATLEVGNLCRADLARLAADSAGGRDALLVNCEPDYCTVELFRSGEPVFFRCKIHSAAGEEEDVASRLMTLRREMSSSMSYFSEKLGSVLPLPALLRNQDPLAEGIEAVLEEVGLSPVRPVEVSGRVAILDGPASLGDRLAPALGVTAGRMR